MRLPRALVLGMTSAVAVSALALSGCSSVPTETTNPEPPALPTTATDQIKDALTDTMAEYKVPGAVVAVCDPGYMTWVTAQGVADKTTKQEMTTDLVWPLRSVTKSFTVTLIMQLVDEGRISLDDPISEYVPDVPNGDTITLRQLADMTSGVPEYTTEAWMKDYLADDERAFTTPELIGYALAEPAQFAPGAKAVYTNTSTLLLGEVVAKVTGQPFEQVLQEQILTPLRLENTRYPTTPDDWSGPHPTGYQPDDSGKLRPQDNNFTVFGPAGAMTSTLSDLCRWGTALGSGELLSDTAQSDRLVGQPLDEGPEYDKYDLGIGELEGWIGHTGEGLGHTVLVMHNAETGTTVVTGMNIAKAGEHVPTQFFRQIAPILDQIPPA